MAALHVSISAEPIAHIGGFQITNSLLTGVIVSILLLFFAISFSSKTLKLKSISRLQSLVEIVIESIFNLCKDIAGETKARIFFPVIATSIIFILFNNWFGLLPGVGTIGINEESSETHASVPQAKAQTQPGQVSDEHVQEVSDPVLVEVEDSHEETTTFVPIFRAATADLNTTIALGLISVLLTQFYGVQFLGLSYFTKFFNFKQGPIFTFVGLLELISEFAKIISFAFRLFGNIFAGEVLLAVIAFLVAPLLPIPFLGLEVFVGFIQALVFAMLTLVFINMATVSHNEH
jgi:F-type H+-transporting ATPase subunit a